MKKKICSFCKNEYSNKKKLHYCSKCGHNVTDNIEKSDIVIFFSNFTYIIGLVFIIISTIPVIVFQLTLAGISIDGETLNIGKNDIIFSFFPVLLLLFGIYLKSIAKDLCLKNIKKKE
jgi:hypothetical protein